jgi:tRNA uracil 4-sulfurtransferase
MLVIIRYGEIALKGLNRTFFEAKLVKNIKKQVGGKVWRKWGRIYAEVAPEDVDKLKNVFGIVSYSPGIETELSYEDIQDKIMNLGLDGYDNNTRFRVSCQRLQKVFEPSTEVAKKVGSFINVNFGFKVDLTNYDINVRIEISSDKAHIFKEKISGSGGLPVGVAGNVECKIDSNKALVASYLLMKRGCRIVPLEGSSPDLIMSLQKYCPYDLNRAKFSTEGVCLSDTLPDLSDVEGFVLRPLVGMDAKDIGVCVTRIKS